MKIIITFFFSFINCYSYFGVEIPGKSPFILNEKNSRILTKNIALIGFNSFSYYEDEFPVGRVPENANVSGRRYTSFYKNNFRYRVAVSGKNQHLIEKFNIGKDLEQFPILGYREDSINHYLMQNFLAMEKEFVSKTKEYSFFESKNLFDKTGRFYRRNIDYYVFMINSPSFQRSELAGYFLQFGSYFVSFFTLNYIPIVDRQQSFTKFLLYDENFVLIDEYEINNQYYAFHTFWDKGEAPCVLKSLPTAVSSREQPFCIWESNIASGEKFVFKVLMDESLLKK